MQPVVLSKKEALVLHRVFCPLSPTRAGVVGACVPAWPAGVGPAGFPGQCLGRGGGFRVSVISSDISVALAIWWALICSVAGWGFVLCLGGVCGG